MNHQIDKGRSSTKPRSRGRIAAGVSLLLVGALSLSACAPGASPGGDTTLGPATTTIPTDEKITISISYWETGGGADAINALIKEYEKAHPNITIKPEFTSFNDYGKRIKLSMSSDSAPDIAEVGQAFLMMGPLVKANLLRPLDDYAALYGWQDRFPTGLLNQSRFTSDGSKFGSGDLYGLPFGGNMVGIFYNKDILANLGIDPNFATVADFEAALKQVKAAGLLPIELGNSDQWPASMVLSSLISQMEPKDDYLSWMYHDEGATFDTPGVKSATETLSSWAANGYLDPAVNGISSDDATARFISGSAAFYISGNWSLSAIEDQMGAAAAFTAFPPATASGPARATGGSTAPFAISTKTSYPDVAASFIDFITSSEAAPALAAGGYATVATSASGSGTAEGVHADFDRAWQNVLDNDGLTLYLDWSTTGMGSTLFPAIQELLAGQTSPSSLITRTQQEWDKGN